MCKAFQLFIDLQMKDWSIGELGEGDRVNGSTIRIKKGTKGGGKGCKRQNFNQLKFESKV